MKKELLKFKGTYENSEFKPTHVKITEEILNHDLNSGLDIEPNTYQELEEKQCPPDTTDGYYLRVGGNCVFFPFG